ncbi:ketosynthase chain-length factor [Amycolatopsis sp. NPDC059657]|uniref:ketosynthase chain-length factor n=1 Tax=Amycolatopsis sp. NPDC059657 TaxID=3346899 RepID=UPI00366F9BC3
MTAAQAIAPTPVARTARAFVSGMSVVTPIGNDLEEYWRNLLAGASGIRPLRRFDTSRFPVHLAGEVLDFDTEAQVPSRVVVQTDRWTHLGMAAARLALADSGVDLAAVPEHALSVHTASSSGGNEFGQREIQALWANGPEHVGAYQSIAWFYAATTGQLSIRHGMKGWSGVLVAEQAGGLDAIAQSRRVLAQGSAVVLTGATEAQLSPYALTCHLAGGQLSLVNDPKQAYRPFDAAASGYVPGEGGAMLVIEPEERAHCHGEVLGHASTFDPAPGSGRPPGLRRAIELALADAGVGPDGIDVVFADALGVRSADQAEEDALAAVFGSGGVPVTTTKTATGRMAAGSAALDVVTALLSIRDGVIPPAITAGDSTGLDLVTGKPRPAGLSTALIVARGYRGFNSALVVTGI